MQPTWPKWWTFVRRCDRSCGPTLDRQQRNAPLKSVALASLALVALTSGAFAASADRYELTDRQADQITAGGPHIVVNEQQSLDKSVKIHSSPGPANTVNVVDPGPGS